MNVQQNGLEIAIIGLSGRFPGSRTIEEFWHSLKAGVESISVLPTAQVESDGTDRSHRGGVLDDIERFDAAFFGCNPREAETMDPQHRLFLECAWQALEQAGYDPEAEERPIGVYAGVGMGTYLLYNLSPNPDVMASRGFLQTLVGVDKDYLSTRVSYKFNLTGPSVSVGTACSSSLVAVHLACQSLLSGECEMALAAGVAVKVPQTELTLSPDEIVSPDGHCRAFDAKANGTVGGNGIGVVVLKRLEDAIRDRDYIYAVIKGSAINNDGAVKVGYTAPSQVGQANVIRAAQVMADVEPESITYMETHGTGTSLGDPIEVAAMTQAFRIGTAKKGYCAIGSVKTNVGHLDAAAGIAGLIKTILALHHKVLPPSLHFETPNAEIDFENSPFYVNTELAEWMTNGDPHRAGVSSFGFGGTNAHLVLESAPLRQASSPSRSQQLLLLSAKTRSALDTITANLADHLQHYPDLNLADVAYTLQVGRKDFEHRRMVVAANLEDAVQALQLGSLRQFTQFQKLIDRPVTFMFTGQGAQYVNMAQELYQHEATFRDVCDRCCDLIQPQLGYDLRQVLYPDAAQAEQATQQLQQTSTTQPALFIIEYALAHLWMSWGVQPTAMIGHSIGEYVAACLAGVFSLEDALSLVVTRGQLMQQQPSGAMLSVGLLLDDVQHLLSEIGEKLSIAVNNGPALSVVSGTLDAIERLERQLVHNDVSVRRLHTSHAFHSEMMDAILEPFMLAVKTVNLNPPQIPLISNVTGTWMTTTDATNPDYWVRHLRQTVRFAEGIAELLQDPERIFLEVGPGQTLSTLTKQQTDERVILSSLRHPKDQQSDITFLLNTLGQLWLAGVRVDWSGFYQNESRDRLPLPTYPFERQRYWIEPPDANSPQIRLGKKPDIADWFYMPSWKRSAALTDQSQEAQSCNLVFIDESSLGIQLIKRLEQQGQDVIAVKVGSEFTRLKEGAYCLNPQSNDYDALLQDLLVHRKIPKKIVHLWSLAPDDCTELGLERVEEAQTTGFYSLLFLAQALGKQTWSNEVYITVVSNNMQSVTGDETLSPAKATMLGPVKVIGQEYPNIRCCSIDVVLPAPGSRQEKKLIEHLLDEITAPTDQIVAYRGSHRWVQTFEPVRLEQTLEGTPGLREGGVYLITGGLGGIGLVLAEHLAKTVRAKLILTGRSLLPDRDGWSHWLATHDETDHVSRKLRKLLELEKGGAEVLVVGAEVTNLDQMQRVITRAQGQFGQLNGVIHAAGLPGGSMIQRKSWEKAEKVLAPKVKGTLVLNAILQNAELDFFVLCSSLASTIGTVGQVDYAAANAFLDAFAHYKRSTDSTINCINWDAWREVGMAVTTPINELPGDLLQNGLFSSEGINVFRRILSSKLPQVFVSTHDFLERIRQYSDNGGVASLATLDQTTISEKRNQSERIYPRPELNTTYIAPRNELEQTIADIWQKVLGVEQIGIHDNLFELGGDSLLGIQIISKLNQEFNMQLTPTALYDGPSVSALAQIFSPDGNERMTESNQRRDRGARRRSKKNKQKFANR